ncbi:hypothetical protein [Dactylosporangium sp. NPDC005555]|uniref:hypothetical protein n=1 Tax=Dactylosporangium sp. NPDC005555 TaxID=3154889 RepID=UPI0033B4EED9
MTTDQSDPARDLIRRAYADVMHPGQSGTDSDSGLADVVRRAGRPRAETQDADVVEPAPRRTRRRFAVVATFAAAVVTILAVYAASAGVRPQGVGTAPGTTGAVPRVTGSPVPISSFSFPPGTGTFAPDSPGASLGAEPSGPVVENPRPFPFPSSCADSWVLEPVGDTIKVTALPGGGCPAMALDRLWLLDASQGNGSVNPGDAVIWPFVPVDGAKGPLQPPFTFRPGGWPGLRKGHLYWAMFVTEKAAAEARPGADAYDAYSEAYHLSGYLNG